MEGGGWELLEEVEEVTVLARDDGACRGWEVMVGEAAAVDRAGLMLTIGGLADAALPDRP